MAKISVVMSVYNGATALPATLDSILGQVETDYELIIVNDGSTDASSSVLRDYEKRDSRIRLLEQTNQGLTRALIAGCAVARGEWIARHDCGDRSMPDRFRKQLDAAGDGVVLISCATRYVGPGGETLYVATGDGEAIRRSLLEGGIDSIQGVSHHGSTMFRRDAYEAAGGYREEFRYAQDLDLWIRLARRGRISVVPDVLYEATYDPFAISASRRSDQFALARISIALRDGESPEALLAKARLVGAPGRRRTRRDEARALYFIASCLKRNGDDRYRRYARAAIRSNPLHARAWLLFVR